MQFDTSSRRGFFGKTLAWLGGFVVGTKAASVKADLSWSPTANKPMRQAGGVYDGENRITCYYDQSIGTTERYFYEVDDHGNVNLMDPR